jgi:uncharacterized SAM-binding protein YcdF (DUF218 family)
VFYALSKIFWFLAQPSSLIALLIAAGIAMVATRFQRAAKRMIWTGAVLLIVLGLSPVGGALILPLEERFPRPDLSQPGTRVDGIIVLGGAEDQRVGDLRKIMALNEGAERMVEAVVLANRFPQAKLVFSGGSAELLMTKPPEGQGAARFFTDLGIAPERLAIEDKSRNTYENAVFTRDLVMPKPGERWLLVTSAFHMPRAMGCFRKAGFIVEAFPVDYRTAGAEEVLHPFSSIPEGLRRIDFVMKEYVGLATYYFSGRTDALFPGPVAIR